MVTIRHVDIDGDNKPDIVEIEEKYQIPNVYFSRSITPEELVYIYNMIKKDRISGNVAIKVHSGEDGNKNFIGEDLYGSLIDHIGGTLVETNTAYAGKRNTTEEHLKTIEKHWNHPFDILDSEDQIALPVNNPIVISENFVGSHMANYNSMVVLSHFKGHAMGGFGGALKNISIGLASSQGKRHIHRVKPEEFVTANANVDQDEFIDAMADAASSVIEYFSGNMIFINVLKNISIDCDCDSHAKKPCMKDIGILASDNPVALDKACLDIIYNWGLDGSKQLINRIESRNGRRILKSMEYHGYKDIYNLINLDITDSIIKNNVNNTSSLKEDYSATPYPHYSNDTSSIDNKSFEEDDYSNFIEDDEED